MLWRSYVNGKKGQFTKRLISLPGIASLLILLGQVALPAQSVPLVFQLDVPFEFFIDGAIMPAGTYWIRASDERYIVILNVSQQVRVYCQTSPISDARLTYAAHLVFRQVKGTHHLTEVWSRTGIGLAIVPKTNIGELGRSGTL